MSLSAATQFEVRTTGSDTNGGGFVSGASGTDYSQQNLAQYAFTDLASSNGTSGSPAVTSASHSFVAADVGNLIHITAGTNWTTGFYQIVSVATGAATLDRACGSAASLSSGTWAEGGALATLSQALIGSAQCAAPSTGTNGATIWMKAGTYTITSTIDTGNGSNQSQLDVTVHGYDVSRGDNTGNRPLITTATNSTGLIKIWQNVGPLTSQYFTLDNVNFSNTAVTPSYGLTTYNNAFNGCGSVSLRNCKATGFTSFYTDSSGVSGNAGCQMELVGCEITGCTSDALHIGNTVTAWSLTGCYLHNNSGRGLFAQSISVLAVIDSIVDSNVGSGVSTGATVLILYGSVFTNSSSSGDGIQSTASTGTGQYSINNCIFYGNSGYGINTQVQTLRGLNNAFGNNTSGNTNSNPNGNQLIGTLTLTANPFTSSTNFAPNSTVGGGVVIKGAGWPTAFGSGTSSTPNVGAVQASGGGGVSGMLTRGDMTGGMFG